MAGAVPSAPRRFRSPGAGIRQVIPLEVIRGRLFLRREAGLVLLDTGSQVSGPPSLALQRQLGVRFYEVLGMDRLREETLLIDHGASRLDIGPALMPGEAIPIQWREGRPLIEISSAGHRYLTVLDTGSAISYAPERVVEAGTAKDNRWESLWEDGPQEVRTARVAVSLGCWRSDLRIAAMPAVLSSTLRSLGLPEWIMGAEVLLRRRILVDFAAGRLVVARRL